MIIPAVMSHLTPSDDANRTPTMPAAMKAVIDVASQATPVFVGE